MLTAGFVIAIGFLLLAVKLPRTTLLKALNYPLAIDLTASVLAYVLHWGTFTGVMAAAVAGLLISVLTSSARWLVGWIAGNKYYPGLIFYYRPPTKGDKGEQRATSAGIRL